MEPITTTILAALAAGAAAAAKDTATTAVKEAYQGLKALVQRRFAGKPDAEMVLAKHAEEPETWKKPMEKELVKAAADKDDEIVKQAQELLKLLPDANRSGPQVYGSGAAASHGGVAAGKGGYAAAGNIVIGDRARKDGQ